jgi:hypothetical protein
MAKLLRGVVTRQRRYVSEQEVAAQAAAGLFLFGDRRHQVVLFAFDGLPVARGDAEVRQIQ